VDRLTAGKEDDGVAIEIGRKKVALGIPGAKPPMRTSGADDPKVYPLILLARPCTADEAAAAMPFVHPLFSP
jgi:3-oxoacyl-[acyl-carrier protein] reductase